MINLITMSKIVKLAVKKYELKNFAFIILELYPNIVTKENNKELLDLEDKYLKLLLPNYNILTEAGSSFGYKHTEVDRQNFSFFLSDERRKMIGNLNRCKKLSHPPLPATHPSLPLTPSPIPSPTPIPSSATHPSSANQRFAELGMGKGWGRGGKAGRVGAPSLRQAEGETIEKIREKALNRYPMYDETKKKCIKHTRPVVLYNLNGTVYGKYSTILDAAKSINCGEKTIRRALKTEKGLVKRQ